MNHYEFYPPKRPGLIFHVILILVFATIMILCAWQASQAEVSLTLVLFVLIAGIAFVPLPFLGYRIYALMRANYILDRDHLTLHWGLRVEQIPISEVEWVRSVDDLAAPLPKPFFRLPGSVLGVRRSEELGVVEFLAADTKMLLLVATKNRTYALSPTEPVSFVQEFRRAMEMGSLARISSQSIYPSLLFAQSWSDRLARFLWLVGLFLNLGLLIWVGLLVPSLSRIPLGFLPSGLPQETVPAVRLILLPIVSIFFLVVGWLAGLYFYRRPDQRVLSSILWASSSLSALLFLLAVLFIVTARA